jgi:hypothetical protein
MQLLAVTLVLMAGCIGVDEVSIAYSHTGSGSDGPSFVAGVETQTRSLDCTRDPMLRLDAAPTHGTLEVTVYDGDNATVWYRQFQAGDDAHHQDDLQGARGTWRLEALRDDFSGSMDVLLRC